MKLEYFPQTFDFLRRTEKLLKINILRLDALKNKERFTLSG